LVSKYSHITKQHTSNVQLTTHTILRSINFVRCVSERRRVLK
jgi:hypothetical protein